MAGARVVAGGEVKSRIRMTVRFDLVDGTDLTMVTTLETAMVPSPDDVGYAFRYLTAPKS